MKWSRGTKHSLQIHHGKTKLKAAQCTPPLKAASMCLSLAICACGTNERFRCSWRHKKKVVSCHKVFLLLIALSEQWTDTGKLACLVCKDTGYILSTENCSYIVTCWAKKGEDQQSPWGHGSSLNQSLNKEHLCNFICSPTVPRKVAVSNNFLQDELDERTPEAGQGYASSGICRWQSGSSLPLSDISSFITGLQISWLLLVSAL